MKAAAIRAARAKRKEMHRDMVVYLLGYGQGQPQEYLLPELTTIPERLNDANVATAITNGN
jgi:hypothetical protein